jgi:hypothetical protein
MLSLLSAHFIHLHGRLCQRQCCASVSRWKIFRAGYETRDTSSGLSSPAPEQATSGMPCGATPFGLHATESQGRLWTVELEWNWNQFPNDSMKQSTGSRNAAKNLDNRSNTTTGSTVQNEDNAANCSSRHSLSTNLVLSFPVICHLENVPMNLYRQWRFICLPERNDFDWKRSFDVNATELVRVQTGRKSLTVDLSELVTTKQGKQPSGPATYIIPIYIHKTKCS